MEMADLIQDRLGLEFDVPRFYTDKGAVLDDELTFCWSSSSPRKETIELILQEVLEYLVYMTGMVREGTGKKAEGIDP